MLPWCRALYHRRSLGMIPVTAYRGVANRGPGALMNCPTFLPMGDNFCLIQVVKTRESKESAWNKSFRVLCTPISGPLLSWEPFDSEKEHRCKLLNERLKEIHSQDFPYAPCLFRFCMAASITDTPSGFNASFRERLLYPFILVTGEESRERLLAFTVKLKGINVNLALWGVGWRRRRLPVFMTFRISLVNETLSPAGKVHQCQDNHKL